MTTSDDEPTFEEQDPLAETTHAEPEGLDDGTEAAYEPPVEPGSSGLRWLLAILAALVIAAAGVTAWALIYRSTEDREFVGISVVVALTAGWVIRVISRSSSVAARIAAVLVTALTCVAGRIFADAAIAAKFNPVFSFGTVFKETLENWTDTLTGRDALTYVIFAAALVIAWMSAGPQKSKAAFTPVPEPAPGDEPVPDPLAYPAGQATATGDDDDQEPST